MELVPTAKHIAVKEFVMPKDEDCKFAMPESAEQKDYDLVSVIHAGELDYEVGTVLVVRAFTPVEITEVGQKFVPIEHVMGHINGVKGE